MSSDIIFSCKASMQQSIPQHTPIYNASILDDQINELSSIIYQQRNTGQLPDASLRERVQTLRNITSKYAEHHSLPDNYFHRLNQLMGLTMQECVRNREEAYKHMNNPSTPFGAFVLWPSANSPGRFGFLQKFPGYSHVSILPASLEGNTLSMELENHLIHYCKDKDTASFLYQHILPGTCVMWPSRLHPRYSRIALKTGAAGSLEIPNTTLVRHDQIKSEVMKKESEYKLQQKKYDRMITKQRALEMALEHNLPPTAAKS